MLLMNNKSIVGSVLIVRILFIYLKTDKHSIRKYVHMKEHLAEKYKKTHYKMNSKYGNILCVFISS